jgi:hypothetical protein
MGGWVISPFLHNLIKVSLYLSFHVKAFNHFPFTSKDIDNTFILELVSYQHLGFIIF